MTLHEAIEKLLKEENRAMTTNEIAKKLNSTKWYEKRDKSSITGFQIHGRTKNYPSLFERNRSLVSLKNLNNKVSSSQVSDNRTNQVNYSLIIVLLIIFVLVIISNSN